MGTDRQMDRVQDNVETGKKIAEISEKCCPKCCDRSGFGDPGLGPAINEAEKLAISDLEINIFTAGARKHSRKLGVSKGSEQGEDAAENPDQEDLGGRSDGLDHIGRDQENTAADGGSDDYSGGGPGTEG